jgi:hypothetical protein
VGLTIIDKFDIRPPKVSGDGVMVEWIDGDTGQRYAMLYERSVAVEHGKRMVQAGSFEVKEEPGGSS